MKIQVTAFAIALSSIAQANSGSGKISKQQYVDNWKGVAIEQMMMHEIPASITLAQGILESANGNSELAQKANNHFGIKCHDWKGDKVYKDDDTKNECFRAYKTAEQSYVDHSEFLKKHKRYAFLFDYKSDDYKSWAKGLKQAGYATNPKYPDLLIGIIEDLNLSQYDNFSNTKIGKQPQIVEVKKTEIKSNIRTNSHQVYIHEKGVKYVVAKKGDTFYTIATEFGLKLSQLYRYNDFDKHKDVLESGDVIYIRPKKRANLFKKEEIVVEKEISLIELSQKQALNINSLKRLNDITNDEAIIASGRKVTLR